MNGEIELDEADGGLPANMNDSYGQEREPEKASFKVSGRPGMNQLVKGSEEI